MELWLSEFGYDTNNNSDQKVPTIAPNANSSNPDDDQPFADEQEVQGRWLVRTYLDVAAAKWDRAMQFCIRDSNSDEDAFRFESSGLVKDKASNYQPKKSYYYVSTMKNVLKGKRFCNELNAFDNTSGFPFKAWLQYTVEASKPRKYLFKNGITGCQEGALPALEEGDVIAAWLPTSNNAAIPDYKMYLPNLDPQVGAVTLVETKPMDKDGIRMQLTVQIDALGRYVSIPLITERPLYVILQPLNTEEPVACSISPVIEEVTTVSCDAVKIKWSPKADYDYYMVYYYEKNDSEENGPPAFNIADPAMKLYSDNLPADCNELVIGGLTKLNDRYWIYIAGVADGVVSDADCGRIDVMTATCTSSIESADLGIDENSDQRLKALFDYSGVTFCYPQRVPITGGWSDWDYNDPVNGNTVTLELPENFSLNAISLFDGSGIGDFVIRYRVVGSGNFEEFNFSPYLSQYFEEWKTFPITPCGLTIDALQFYKKDPMANILRIVLYGGTIQSGGVQTADCCNPATLPLISNMTVTQAIAAGLLLDNSSQNNLREVIIEGTLTVNTNYDFYHSKLYMMPGSKIMVAAGKALTIDKNSVLEGCDQMWQGIHLRPASRLWMRNSFVRDALAGIDFERDDELVGAQTFAGISGSVFEKNLYGIRIPPNSATSSDISPLTYCVASHFDGNGADLKPAYPGQPEWQTRSFKGMDITDVNSLVIGNASGTNQFRRLIYGIQSERSTLMVRNSQFRNIPVEDNDNDEEGWGITCKNGQLTFIGLGKGEDPNVPFQEDYTKPATFDEVYHPVALEKMTYNVKFSKIRNSPFGIHVLDSKQHLINNTISDNFINVTGTGIYAGSNSLPSIKIEKNTVANFTGEPGDGIYCNNFAQPIGGIYKILDNRIRVGGGANSAGIRVLGGVNAIVSDNRITLTGSTNDDNSPTTGIYAAMSSGIQVVDNRVEGDGNQGNNIDCTTDVLGPYNPSLFYCAPAPNGDGIPDCNNDCDGDGIPNLEEDDDGDGVPNWADNATNAAGIFVLSSPMSTVGCNYTSKSVTGLAFAEDCTSINGIGGNELDVLATGVWLRDAAIVGNQFLRGNKWLKPINIVNYPGRGARHWSGLQANWLQSQFTVDPALLGHDPANWVLPTDAAGIWFQPFPGGGSNSSCPANVGNDNGIPLRQTRREASLNTGGTYLDFAANGTSGLNFAPASRWNLERHIYSTIREQYPSQIPAGALNNFVQSKANTTVGLLTSVEKEAMLYPSLDTPRENQLADLNEDVEAYMQSVEPLTDQLSVMDLPDQANWLANNGSAGSSPDFIRDAWELDSVLQLTKLTHTGTIAAANNGVTVTEDFEDYDRAMNGIFFATIGSGIYELSQTQQATVLSVAVLCTTEGGEAVIKARVLYSLVDPRPRPEWDECYSLANMVGERSVHSSPSFKEDEALSLVIFPNPANNRFGFITSGGVREWYLANTFGRIVKSGKISSNVENVSTENLPSGLYFLKIRNNARKSLTQKVLIIH
jgi:hypothetical protein